jgi:hypothetical protein
VLASTGTRTARFAAWVTALLDGRCSPADTVDGIVGEDAFHDVAQLPEVPDSMPLAPALDVIAGLGLAGVRYASAAPGRVGALPGPAPFNQAAVAAGGAAVAVSGSSLAWLPSVTQHGPAGDAVTSVTWVTHPVSVRVWAPEDVSSTARQLVSAFQAAIDDLHRLDVARERPGVRELLRSRTTAAPSHALPPGHPPAASELLDRVFQLQQVVALAREDDGGAVTGAERDRRADVLRVLELQLQDAEMTAWNAGLPRPGAGWSK